MDALSSEELSLRESRRVKTAPVVARLSTIETSARFDFASQPSLDRIRILALAGLGLVDRCELVTEHVRSKAAIQAPPFAPQPRSSAQELRPRMETPTTPPDGGRRRSLRRVERGRR